MAFCTGCAQEIPLDGPITASEVEEAVYRATSLYNFTTNPASWKLKIRGKEYVPEVIERNGTAPTDHYGELPQGDTFDLFVVFRVGEQFFKLNGEMDSYGNNTWNGIRCVKPVQKTVTVWD